MRETVKKVEFDTPFRYSYSGNFHESGALFVAEPNFQHRQVYRTMQGWVAEAQRGIMKNFPTDEATKKKAEQTNVDQSDEVVEEKKDEPKDDDDFDVMMTMRMGLSADRYSAFADFVQKCLTGATALCYIETEDSKRVPVRDETWESIAGIGGLSELDRIFGVFASFFTDTRPATSRKGSGSGSPSTPGATPKGESPITKH